MRILIIYISLLLTNGAFATVVCSPTECYTLTQQIGEGAYGKVHVGENEDGKKFAIKIYKPGRATKAENEYEIGQKLSHPNIVKTSGAFTSEDGKEHLVLELVEGKTIRETSVGELTGQEAKKAAIRLVDALRYAYKMGFMHIDLSYNNVMLDKNHELIVIDLASFIHRDEFKRVLLFDSGSEAAEISFSSSIVSNSGFSSSLFFESIGSIASFDSPEEGSVFSRSLAGTFSYLYFEQIGCICLELILKSDLSFDERMQLTSEIDDLILNYKADLKERCEAPMDDYFTQLIEVIETV